MSRKFTFILLILFGMGVTLLAEDKAVGDQSTIPPRRETLVVTGEPQPVPLDEVDRAVTTLDTRTYPQLYRNWSDYVQLEPSLDFAQRVPGLEGDLSIRGSTFGQTLVLVNGFRVNDAQTGHHNLDIPLPESLLDRIEILRGAGSTLYGSDALGGAVNFIVSPPPVTDFRLRVAGGSFGTTEQDASAAYVSRRFSQQLAVTRDFSTGFAPDRDFRNLALGSTTHFDTRLGDSAVLLGYSDRPFGADQFYGNYNSWERTKAWFASLKQQLGDRTELNLGYRRHTDEFILLRDKPLVYENNHETESWQGAIRRRQQLWQNATLFYGAEFFHDAINSNNLGRHARNRGAGYADFDVRAWHRFSFSAGLREELYGDYRSELSPSVSAGVWLSSKVKLRAGAGHAFRVPTYTELYYRDPATVGNAALRPESAWSYEGGLDWHTTTRVTTLLTVFHRRERDDIDYVRSSPADQWHAVNIQRLNFTGVEAAVRVRVFRTQQLEFAYTGIHGVQEALAGLTSKYVGNYPSQNAVASWQGILPGKLLARTRIGATQRRSQSTYALWDFSAARQFRRFSPFVQFANLTNTSYEELPGVVMPGRSVMAGVEFALSAKGK